MIRARFSIRRGACGTGGSRNDFAHFRASGARLAAQFDTYQPFPDLHVNGEQTLGENIADVAGLNAAYDAYHLAARGAPPAEESKFGGDQQFFLSFAQSWRSKTRDPALRAQIITDGHAPAQYRSYTVRNLDAWYAAFKRQARREALSCAGRTRSGVVNLKRLN